MMRRLKVLRCDKEEKHETLKKAKIDCILNWNAVHLLLVVELFAFPMREAIIKFLQHIVFFHNYSAFFLECVHEVDSGLNHLPSR